MKKRWVFLLPLAALIALSLVSCGVEAVQEQAGNLPRSAAFGYEQKVYSKATVDDDFDETSLIVILDKKNDGINKQHETGFFGGLDIEYITDLTRIESKNPKFLNRNAFHQILLLKLKTDGSKSATESGKSKVVDSIRQIENIPGILYAGPNYRIYPEKPKVSKTQRVSSDSSSSRSTLTPNDPDYDLQWNLHGEYGIHAPEAWEITTGSSDVRVGIIDYGLSSTPI